MISLSRKEWLSDPKLNKWNSIGLDRESWEQGCGCNSDTHHIELWEQDSCVRGRIDTIICTLCDSIKSFKIVR